MPADDREFLSKYLRGTDFGIFRFAPGGQLKNATAWQSIFIRDNFPLIGYWAWQGFQLAGAGLLYCRVEPPPLNSELRCHFWNFTTQFVSSQCIADCLLNLQVPAAEISPLVVAIQQYVPQQEVALLIGAGKSVDILMLTNLAIAPPVSYQQILDRWDEFMPDARHSASL
jgi:hypothetical protein